MEMTPVYTFTDPVDFLNSTFQEIQKDNPQFSLRAWARNLGLSHVAMLSMVLSKKRRLLPNLSSKICQDLIKRKRLTETEARYLDMLVLFANSSTEEEKTFYERILASLRPDQKFSTLQLDQMRIISDWYHFAILEMTNLKNFNSDPQWITRHLGGSVNQSQVVEAIERLCRLGLLETDANGTLKKTNVRLATPTDIPNKSLRKFHKTMLEKATMALEEQSVERRDISGHMLVIDRKKIPEAKRMIQDFRRRLADFLETSEGDAVYQIGIQLFDVLGEKDV